MYEMYELQGWQNESSITCHCIDAEVTATVNAVLHIQCENDWLNEK